MIKNLFIFALCAIVISCSNLKDEGKTPQTEIGKLNSCMLDKAYDLKSAGTLFQSDKWTTASRILSACEHKLNIPAHEVNEKQSLNIIVSVIDSMR